MKKFFSFCWEITKIIVVAGLIVFPIRYFLFQPFVVRGQSMEPNFKEGDYLIVDEISYRFRKPLRGEVIVFKYPNNPSQRFIKRVIGLPGEVVEIKNGRVLISQNGKSWFLNEKNYLPSIEQTIGNIKITLQKDEYFVLGDNRDFSFDSRRFGVVPAEDIIGRVLIKAWPFSDFALIKAPVY